MIFTRRVKLLALVVAAFVGLSGLRLALASLQPENAARKDFQQEYLMARALAAGVAPYQPLPQLAAQLRLPISDDALLQHPAPHTPVMALLSWPLAFVALTRAATIWLALGLFGVWLAALFLLRWYDKSINVGWAFVIALAALGWSHVWEDLVLGQSSCLLLPLLVGAWLCLRNGRVIGGGALLGLSLGLKLIFWPLALWLVVRRMWRAALTTGLAFVLLNLAAAAVMGGRVVLNYYLHVGPTTAALYRTLAQNLSLWSLGWRVFTGTGSAVANGVVAPPLMTAPRWAAPTSWALVAALLTTALYVTRPTGPRAQDFDSAWALMLCLCLLISPLTWTHYLVLLALPLIVALRRLQEARFPRKETLAYLAACALLWLPGTTLENFIFSFSALPVTEARILPDVPVPFAAALLSLLPTLGVLLLGWLLYRLARAAQPAAQILR